MENGIKINLSPDRPAVWFDENLKMTGFRPSSIGGCIRSLVASRVGLPKSTMSESSKEIANEGFIHEPHIIEWIVGVIRGIHPGCNISVDTQMTLFVPVVIHESFLAGSADAIIKVDSGSQIVYYLIESKALGDKTFKDTESSGPSIQYLYQIGCYDKMVNYVIDGMRDKIISNEISSPWPVFGGTFFAYKRRATGEKKYIFYEEPKIGWNVIEDRIGTVQKLYLDYLVKSKNSFSGIFPPCDNISFFCQHSDICQSISDRPIDRKQVYDASLSGLARQYSELSKTIAELESKKQCVKEKLEIAMNGRWSVKTDGFTLYYSSRSRTDERELLASHPEARSVYQKFDLDKAIRDNPEWKTEFQVSGERFLTVKSIGGPKTEKKDPSPKKLNFSNASTDELMEFFKEYSGS